MGHQYLYSSGFFQRPSVEIAPELLGAKLCCRSRDGRISKFTICETEAYHGVEDLASHACRGKIPIIKLCLVRQTFGIFISVMVYIGC